MRWGNSIVDAIGGTPIIELGKSVEQISPTVLAKLEFLNPGGSVKDRVGAAMIRDAERRGLIRPGATIVEPTSGNTGIGLAMTAAVRGYKMIFTIPDKMSREKIDQLRAYGAEVVVTPTDVSPDDPRNFYRVAESIVKEKADAFMPDQYTNPANPQVHYETTGSEIWEQTGGEVDVVVVGMGTGGTATGVSKYLKEKKDVTVVGVDPEGSLFHHEFYETEEKIHTYKTEGIGEDFLPDVLDLHAVDEIVTVSDRDAFLMARRLAREEGLLVGSSSGAAVHATVEFCGELEEEIVVVILPDTGKNYMSTLYSDDWMREQGFLEGGDKEYGR